jgi:hypothetical protein
MRAIYTIVKASSGRSLAVMAAPAVFALLLVGVPRWSFASTAGPTTFSSAEEASQALLQAVQNHDERALQAILGAGKEVTSSGDDDEDMLEREQFSEKYQEMHRLVREPDATTVLYIGAENWPFPIPLTSKNGRWHFDSQTGMREILFRRIGENEATAIEVCRSLAMAEKEPALEKQPFGGYYFRAVGAQSGTMAFSTNSGVGRGTKTADLAFVAYPAEYRSSGVMTFVVTKDGVVFERDLGPETSTLAQAINERGPTSRWDVVK